MSRFGWVSRVTSTTRCTLHFLLFMTRPALLSLLSLSILTACGTDTQPRLGDAGPRPAEVSRRSGERLGASGAVLVATGRQSFEGILPVRCAVHEGDGLQLNLRTGDPDLPAVAVRIDDLGGLNGGPYRGRLFVTGRGRSGGLASSTGEVSVEIAEQGSRLQGSFTGSYDGAAGRGSVQGRFRGCALPRNGEAAEIASSSVAR